MYISTVPNQPYIPHSNSMMSLSFLCSVAIVEYLIYDFVGLSAHFKLLCNVLCLLVSNIVPCSGMKFTNKLLIYHWLLLCIIAVLSFVSHNILWKHLPIVLCCVTIGHCLPTGCWIVVQLYGFYCCINVSVIVSKLHEHAPSHCSSLWHEKCIVF